jgi:hypothetical protein
MPSIAPLSGRTVDLSVEVPGEVFVVYQINGAQRPELLDKFCSAFAAQHGCIVHNGKQGPAKTCFIVALARSLRRNFRQPVQRARTL